MRQVVKVIKFDPTYLTNFLNAKKDAEYECKKRTQETGDLHCIMRSKKDEIEIIRYHKAERGR